MVLSLVPGMGLTTYAAIPDNGTYIVYTANGTTATSTEAAIPTGENVVEITASNVPGAWEGGKTYVVTETASISTRITVTGTANLILTDGNTLTASKGITVTDSNILNIHAQSEGNSAGELLINNVDSSYAGIGGISYRDNGMKSSNGGSVNIHGGKITVAGGSGAAGIGGGYGANGGTVTIYGGAVTATGGDGGAGIGGGKLYNGNGGNGGTVTIYGGTVTAKGNSSYGGTGIGVSCDNYGNSGNAGTVIINGGTVTATGGYSSAGICSGTGNDGEVIINGGTVSATGGDGGAGIGGGAGSNGGIVTINGGTVSATGGNSGAGIGSGRLDMGNNNSGIGGRVTINGGTVTATGGAESCMGIGGVRRRDEMTRDPLPPKNGTLSVGSGLKVYGGNSANPTTELTQFSTIYSDDYNETTVYRYMIVSAPLHEHSFTYSVNGDTITATCGEDDCPLTNKQATLTIAPPSEGGNAAELTGDVSEFDLTGVTITYQKKVSSGWQDTEAPDNNASGIFKASITLKGTDNVEATAFVTYGVSAVTKGNATNPEGKSYDFTVPKVAAVGAKITPTPTTAFDTGYGIKKIIVKDENQNDVSAAVQADTEGFIMPEYNVTVDVEFGLIDYIITINETSNGTVTANKNGQPVSETNPANYGDTVTLVAAPDDGFALKSFTVKDSNNHMLETSGTGNTRTFTMPAANVTVSTMFEGAPYNLKISDEITGGTVTAQGNGISTANNVTTAKAGSEVTLTVTPDTGFNFESLTVTKTADNSAVSVTKESDTIYKFTMPKEAVSVSATFVGKDTSLTLSTAGNSGTTCTAKLLDSSYNEISSVTKKAGEEFILRINKDEGYSYQVSFTPNATASMREFSTDDYKAYINSTKSESLNTSLYWVTMPGADAGSVNMTVTFRTAKIFTILYQPSAGSNPNEVWVKFGYTENNEDKLVTAKMSPDAKMGNVAVWSLKMSAAFNPDKIAIATSESAAESADTQSATVSTTDSWSDITGGQYLIIGNNAKTVIAAFTDDSSSANTDREATVISIGDNATYQIAICASGGSGSITTPTAPTRTGYDFVAWRGYEGITAKDYAANTQISVNENMAFSAVWQPKNPNVKLNLNGGTGIANTEFTVSYNDNTTLASLTPAKSGYSFAGWSVAKDVTEDGKLYTRGAPFDTGTKITADLELTAQWKHVHAYGYFQIGAVSSLATKYAAYAPYLHIKICGCGDVDLEAHSLNSDGVCACGYGKSGDTPTSATLKVSYGQWLDGNYTEKMAELPETVAADSEVSVSAPGKWGNLIFSKWQYKAEGDTGWTDAGAYKMMSFVIPGNMEMRALYVNATTVPEVSLSATTYETTASDGNLYDSILFQMNYKLPDGYTYVDAGVRSGDNAGISYYELKERTATMDAEAKAITYSLAAAMSVLSGELTTFDTSGTEQYYAKRENSVLDESGMTAAKLGEYMYQSKPINIKDAPLYWNYKPTVTGQSGSINALTPVGFAQRNNGDHYIYAIAYLTDKDSSGTTHTIYTPALATTLNGISSAGTVSKSGS